MASASMTRVLSRRTTRPILFAIVVVALAMVGLALLAEAMSGGGGTVYLAQIEPGGAATGRPSLVAVGYGQATVPAERADVQLMFTDLDSYYRGEPSSAPTPGATPGAAERAAAEPIVKAIVATGVPAEQVDVVTSPTLGFTLTGPSSSLAFRIDVTVDQPELTMLAALVDTAGQTGLEHGFQLVQAGAAYRVADCAAVRDRAWEAALAESRRRAAAQATLLGVALGDLLVSQEEPAAIEGGASVRSQVVACGVDDPPPTLSYGMSAVLSIPPFDPTAPAEVVVAVRLRLAYEITKT
jgi:hypothetical protein